MVIVYFMDQKDQCATPFLVLNHLCAIVSLTDIRFRKLQARKNIKVNLLC